MVVCTTRHWQLSGYLVQELNFVLIPQGNCSESDVPEVLQGEAK